MAVSAGFRSFVLGQLEALGDVTGRSMFGGVGFYKGDVFFAIAARDVLYLKVDDQNAGMFVEAGMRPFKPFKGRPGTMRYYEVPLAVLESAPELVRWARMSVAVAARAEGVRGPKN
jgi:DNA transformation protein